MSSAERARTEPSGVRQTTGIVDVTDMTAGELQAFIRGERSGSGEIAIRRRGTETFLLTE